MKPLWKTTIVIWSEQDPQACDITTLAEEATVSEHIKRPADDDDWDGTEFFDES